MVLRNTLTQLQMADEPLELLSPTVHADHWAVPRLLLSTPHRTLRPSQTPHGSHLLLLYCGVMVISAVS